MSVYVNYEVCIGVDDHTHYVKWFDRHILIVYLSKDDCIQHSILQNVLGVFVQPAVFA